MSNIPALIKPTTSVIVGVDTHKHVHVAVAIDTLGAPHLAPATRRSWRGRVR